MPYTLVPIPALQDNYIWMIIHRESHKAVVVDPGDAKAVQNILKKHKLQLAAILLTHHHWDHTNGAQELSTDTSAPIYGPTHPTLSFITHQVTENDLITIQTMQLSFNTIAVPGHTLSHLAYTGHGWLFSGDTLFASGCGRLFEGTPQQMFSSLTKLTKLPKNTLVYCGHEYTLNNLKFAQLVEPKNKQVTDKISKVNALRAQNKPSLPTTLSEETQTNPFLRCHTLSVKKAAETYSKKGLTNEVEIFATIRKWKDEWY